MCLWNNRSKVVFSYLEISTVTGVFASRVGWYLIRCIINESSISPTIGSFCAEAANQLRLW